MSVRRTNQQAEWMHGTTPVAKRSQPWQTSFIYFDARTKEEVSRRKLFPELPDWDGQPAITLIDSWRLKSYSFRNPQYLYADYSPAKRYWMRLLPTQSAPANSVTEWVLMHIDRAVQRLKIRKRLAKLLGRYKAQFIRVQLENFTGSWDAMFGLAGVDAFFHNLTLALFHLCEQAWPDATVTDYEPGAPVVAQLSVLIGSDQISLSTAKALPRSKAFALVPTPDCLIVNSRRQLEAAASQRRPPLVLAPPSSPIRPQLVRLVQDVLDQDLLDSVRTELTRHETSILLFRPEAPELATLLEIEDLKGQVDTRVKWFVSHAEEGWHDPTEWTWLTDAHGVPAARFVVSLLPHLRYPWQVTRRLEPRQPKKHQRDTTSQDTRDPANDNLEQLKPPPKSFKPQSRLEPAYMEALCGIAQRAAVGQPDPRDRASLLRVIRQARDETPPDKDKFVNLVNRSLDALSLRIRLDDGSIAWLRTSPGMSGQGFIQFQRIPTGAAAGWFKRTPVALVPYEHGNRTAKSRR